MMLVSLIGALSVLAAVDGLVSDATQCCICGSLMPENVYGDSKPQTMPSPFKIMVQEDAYDAGTEIHVNLTSTTYDTFRSFMLVAYTHDSLGVKKNARGKFFLLKPKDYATKPDCPYTDSTGNSAAVVSKAEVPVRQLAFVWIPPKYYGHIEFRATFIKDDQTFWVKEKSRVIYDRSKGVPPAKSPKFIPSINIEQCGKSKGCYREPEGCTEPRCLYIVTWRSLASTIEFEIGALTNGASDSYVAVALSDDIYVGDDTVLVCADNVAHDSTEVYLGKLNDDYETTIVPKYEMIYNDKAKRDERRANYYKGRSVVTADDGSHAYNRLRCRFTVARDLAQFNKTLKSIRGGPSHLIISRGFAVDGRPKPIGVGHDEYPHVSAEKVDFSLQSDSSGRATYPLVKAHGCLMIIAWVLFSSVGFLLAKYYQPMWPEKRVNERKYWFMGHVNCMAMVILIVVIAVILIFIEADGWTKAEDLPYRAHPILGIIILVCVLLLPFIGLLRPAPGDRCRNVFNWLYWIFATIANVLAIPNIFIGMDFGKSMVPWWATWILVIWVIFHIVVEIILEVHQCMTHKKNKERRKKHELLKRDYPKQHHPKPEPAGRGFKRFMLTLHLVVTIIIVLIMVIVIAVSS